MHEFAWGVATHPGHIRSVNEDAVLAGPELFVVADGMGGHAAGDVASSLAIAELAQIAEQEPLTAREVLGAVASANQRIMHEADEDDRRDGMGTTIAVVARCTAETGDEVLLVANVGDSRVYRWTEGVLDQLSVDHSVVAELIAAGEINPAEATTHEQRHTITRALGLIPDVEVEWQVLTPASGDRFLICSDGLTNEVEDAELAQLLDSEQTAAQQAQLLLDLALARGARDNVSVVVLDVGAASCPAEAATDTRPTSASDDTRPRPFANGGVR